MMDTDALGLMSFPYPVTPMSQCSQWQNPIEINLTKPTEGTKAKILKNKKEPGRNVFNNIITLHDFFFQYPFLRERSGLKGDSFMLLHVSLF